MGSPIHATSLEYTGRKMARAWRQSIFKRHDPQSIVKAMVERNKELECSLDVPLTGIPSAAAVQVIVDYWESLQYKTKVKPTLKNWSNKQLHVLTLNWGYRNSDIEDDDEEEEDDEEVYDNEFEFEQGEAEEEEEDAEESSSFYVSSEEVAEYEDAYNNGKKHKRKRNKHNSNNKQHKKKIRTIVLDDDDDDDSDDAATTAASAVASATQTPGEA